jgi:DNA-binding response OmpR family regulator
MTDSTEKSEPTEVTVLVVDDEEDIADLYSTWLDSEFTVRTAYGPNEALEKADDDLDVVFLDRQMPEMTGDEVLDELREREVGARVVMVTAVDPDFDIVEMPFDDYLTKPVMMDDLFDIADKMLSRENYDEQMQDYFALASKKATLEAEKDPVELEESEEYQQLDGQLDEMRDEADDAVDDLTEEEDFEAVFEEFPGEG